MAAIVGIRNEPALGRLADRLDPVSAAFGFVGGAAEGVITVVGGLLEGMLSPGFILIGGIGTIIIGLYVYYMVWAILCGWALWHVILPGGAAFVACGVGRRCG